MKTNKNVEGREPRVEGRTAGLESRHPSLVTHRALPGVDDHAGTTFRMSCPRRSTLVARQGFTLIEVLVVIALIAALAALILPVAGVVKRHAFIQTAQSEMSQLQTAIESYHSAYGFYPPGCQKGPLTNQLYFELVGTTNEGGTFVTLDSSAQIKDPDLNTFAVSGFMNCNKPGADESAPHAQDFLPGLKPNQIATLYTNGLDAVKILVVSEGGPDPDYKPLGTSFENPWRYAYPGTNNPGSYDLWVQLQISGKKYLICNWTKQVEVNSPYD